jgi:hypothetical protein
VERERVAVFRGLDVDVRGLVVVVRFLGLDFELVRVVFFLDWRVGDFATSISSLFSVGVYRMFVRIIA